ncbi:uncharacterized protein K02A2.6-like [Stylophora pistillata]|uniref:uncharacterized protein K02A2.6-like n=1 Tax=Stylophora pistillata TaxID=50429 RepID=UPI000C04B46B|nr:uncharacterized protein K02A2.6-like [Stylophora pistillata]
MKKPLHVAPLRLQRMLVQLQRFPGINVVYKRADSLYLADALSRAHLEEELTNAQQLDINLGEDVISDHQLARFAKATEEDAILSDLQQGMIVKGQKIVVPGSLRKEMLGKLHEGHLGINKTIARAWDVLFWPRTSVEITKKIENCPICLEIRLSQQPEPLKSHEIPPLPWAKVGTDILHKNGRNYLVTVDYYSKWPEITLLPSMKSAGIVTALKSQFARYGVPSVVVSDNGPCYNSAIFRKFSEDWSFEHIT